MVKPQILVTTAAGKTGSAVAKQLLEKGFPVRAFVRRRDHRSEALKDSGAEVFVGNILDARDLRRVLKDVQRAYFCPPVEPNGLYAGAAFAAAAEEAKLEVVTAMSQWLPHPAHPSIATRELWLMDRIMSWMPNVDLITVNPGWFADNYFFVLEQVAQLGLMPMPLGQGLNAPPSNEDIARVVVGTLAEPMPHIGKTYRPTGPKLISPVEIAAILGKALGRSVKYQEISERMFLKAFAAQKRPEFAMTQLRYYGEDYRRNAFGIGAPTDAVREVGRRKPEDFETITRRYVAERPEAVQSFSNKLKAIRFFVKMLLTPAPDMEEYEKGQNHPLIHEPVYSPDSEEWLASHREEQGTSPIPLRPLQPQAG
jgi:uncharacterized protein YbjT (DUF2867 family)